MVLLHVAWFRFRDDVPRERIAGHLAAVRALAGAVPAVRAIACGPNASDRAGRFTHGIVVTLAGREALPAYLDHPAHAPVAAALVADVAELRVMDIEG